MALKPAMNFAKDDGYSRSRRRAQSLHEELGDETPLVKNRGAGRVLISRNPVSITTLYA